MFSTETYLCLRVSKHSHLTRTLHIYEIFFFHPHHKGQSMPSPYMISEEIKTWVFQAGDWDCCYWNTGQKSAYRGRCLSLNLNGGWKDVTFFITLCPCQVKCGRCQRWETPSEVRSPSGGKLPIWPSGMLGKKREHRLPKDGWPRGRRLWRQPSVCKPRCKHQRNWLHWRHWGV